MKPYSPVCLYLLIATFLSPTTRDAAAQGTISETLNGTTVNFVRTASSFDTSPEANFTGLSATATQDHVFETGWWIRVIGGSQETFFPVPTTQNYTSTQSTLDWNDFIFAFQGPLDAQEIGLVTNAKLTPGSPNGGLVIFDMEIINNNLGPITFDLFHMADFDLAGASNDSVSLMSSSQPYAMRIVDGANTAFYSGSDADSYLVRAFNSANDVAALLSDTSITDFDNSGLPFGPGDMTAGFQWRNRTVPGGGFLQFSVALAVNSQETFNPEYSVNIGFKDSFETKTVTLYSQFNFVQQLVSFKADSPQTVRVIQMTGLGNDILRGLAFRPSTGELYSVKNSSSASALWTINPNTGASTQVSGPLLPGFNVSGMGLAFDPVQDRLRLIGDNTVNRRINTGTGGLISNTPDIAFTWATGVGDPNEFAGPPQISFIAHTNGNIGVTDTRLIGVTDQLIVVSINPNTGVINTLGSLPPPPSPVTLGGLVIDPDSSIAYIMYENHLYSFNLIDFTVTDLGAINFPNLLDGLSMQPR